MRNKNVDELRKEVEVLMNEYSHNVLELLQGRELYELMKEHRVRLGQALLYFLPSIHSPRIFYEKDNKTLIDIIYSVHLNMDNGE